MTDTVSKFIPEEKVEGKRLGRHIEHDPRSRDYPYLVAKTGTLEAVEHKRHGTILDQGSLGSCTGNALAGARNTEPVYRTGAHVLLEAGAKAIYEVATIVDGFPGHYPPDDTGSSGLAVAKAAKYLGMISGYKHAFNLDAALAALQVGPVITGVNWYEGFDTPDGDGFVSIKGQVRGGHELVARGYVPGPDLDMSLILLDNSWGTGWGLNGHFYWTVATWRRLLAEGGDVTILLP